MMVKSLLALLTLVAAVVGIVAVPDPASATDATWQYCQGPPESDLNMAKLRFGQKCNTSYDPMSGRHRCDWAHDHNKWRCDGSVPAANSPVVLVNPINLEAQLVGVDAGASTSPKLVMIWSDPANSNDVRYRIYRDGIFWKEVGRSAGSYRTGKFVVSFGPDWETAYFEIQPVRRASGTTEYGPITSVVSPAAIYRTEAQGVGLTCTWRKSNQALGCVEPRGILSTYLTVPNYAPNDTKPHTGTQYFQLHMVNIPPFTIHPPRGCEIGPCVAPGKPAANNMPGQPTGCQSGCGGDTSTQDENDNHGGREDNSGFGGYTGGLNGSR